MDRLKFILFPAAIVMIISCHSNKPVAMPEPEVYHPCSGQDNVEYIYRWQVVLTVYDTINKEDVRWKEPVFFNGDTLGLGPAIVNNYKIPDIVKEYTVPGGARYFYASSVDSFGNFTPPIGLRNDKLENEAGKELGVVLRKMRLLNDSTYNKPYIIMLRLKAS